MSSWEQDPGDARCCPCPVSLPVVDSVGLSSGCDILQEAFTTMPPMSRGGNVTVKSGRCTKISRWPRGSHHCACDTRRFALTEGCRAHHFLGPHSTVPQEMLLAYGTEVWRRSSTCLQIWNRGKPRALPSEGQWCRRGLGSVRGAPSGCCRGGTSDPILGVFTWGGGTEDCFQLVRGIYAP